MPVAPKSLLFTCAIIAFYTCQVGAKIEDTVLQSTTMKFYDPSL